MCTNRTQKVKKQYSACPWPCHGRIVLHGIFKKAIWHCVIGMYSGEVTTVIFQHRGFEWCNLHYFQIIPEYFENKALSCIRAHGILPRSVSCPHFNFSTMWKKNSQDQTAQKLRFLGERLQRTHLAPFKIISFVNHWLQKEWDHKNCHLNALAYQKQGGVFVLK